MNAGVPGESVTAAETPELETLRAAFGRFATGVAIVTCVDAQGRRFGLTVNSFNSLSLDPPLALWSLRQASPSLPAFAAASHFAVNLLALDQIELSQRFATRSDDRFAAGSWSAGLGGAPLLGGCVAVLECTVETLQLAGDHMLFIGRVIRARQAELPPLVYHAGRYRELAPVPGPVADMPI